MAVSSGAAPIPVLTSLASTTGERWDGAKTFNVTGTGFTAASQAKVDGVSITTVYNSATSLTITLPNTVLWEVGAKTVTIVTAGGTTAGATYTVSNPTYLHAEYRPDAGRTMNGATVQGLADQSSKGDANRNLFQLTASAQPTYNASDAAYNNQATLTLDGGDSMKTGQWSSPPAQACRHYWVGQNSNAATAVMFDSTQTWGGRNVFFRSSPTQVTMGAGTMVASLLWDSTTKAIAIVEFNGASSAFGKSSKTLTALGTTTGTNTLDSVCLGSVNGGSSGWMNGTFAHHLVIKSSLMTVAQHGEICDYLGNRYSITVAA